MSNSNDHDYKFQGRYKAAAESIAKAATNYFGCSVEQATRLGNSFMADYGQRKKETKDDGITLKFGKVDKDGNISMAEIEKMVSNGVSTPAISIGNVIYAQNKVIKTGIVYAETKLKLAPRLNDWLFRLEEVEEAKAPAVLQNA